MACSVGYVSLTWVNSQDGTVSKSPKVRTIIRKQAMSKAAVARKRRNSSEKIKQRQYPVLAKPPEPVPLYNYAEEPEHEPTTEVTSHHDWAWPSPMEVMVAPIRNSHSSIDRPPPYGGDPGLGGIPWSPSSTGYEAARIRYDFDVIELSALTAIHIGRATAEPLHDRPPRLLEILQSKQWSYFDYLPGRYGQTPCLDDAICCVAARVRQWITNHSKPTRQVLELYCRAVKSLQAALDDPCERLHPNVLCATEVLSIYELLDEDRGHAWYLHAAGASSLIRLRGPDSYQTDFERALFIAQVGPIYTESILRISQCFLQQPAWQSLFQSLMTETTNLPICGNTAASMWACISQIPGLSRNILALVSDPPEMAYFTRDSLLARSLKLRSQLMALGKKHNFTSTVRCGPTEFSYLLAERPETDESYELLGLFTASLLVLERNIVILDQATAPVMEAHVQQLAWEILALKKDATASKPRAALSLALKVMIAKAAVLTAGEWQQAFHNRGPEGMISETVIRRWVGLSCPRRVTRAFQMEHPQLSKFPWPLMSEAIAESKGGRDEGAKAFEELLKKSREVNLETVASHSSYLGMMFCQSMYGVDGDDESS
ncbi:MAG: hypothetical protein Q9174_003163 [Haloplaca sp. 1 TL-2023]